MKKLYYPLFALATMAMTTSCSDELENGAVSNSNEATVSFKVQLENTVGSRAVIGDGTSAKYLTFAIFKAEANAIGDEVEALRQQVEVQDDLTATVTTRLVKGQTYNFVFWAQTESVALEDDATTTDINEKGAGTYYNIADMSKIKVNYTDNKIAANDEKRDAFYASRNNLTVKGPITETITLKRPFAQVNVGTKEGSLAESATAETNITKSSITFSEVATELYPYSGQVGGKAENVEYTIAAIPEDLTTTSGDLQKVMVDGKETAFEYLSMNYILVNDQSQNGDGVITGANQDVLNNATFKIYDENDAVINTFEIPNLPVQRNWRTNIIGDILNETVTFNVVIDPKFDNDENYISNEELAYVLANGGTYTMEEDLTLESSLQLNNGVSVVLNLNGHNITAASTDAIVIDGGSTLTINGNGNVWAATDDVSSANAIWLKHGKAIINGGNYYVGADNDLRNDCIYVGSDAQKDNAANLVSELVINGGTFEAKVKELNQYWVLNLQDKFYTAGSSIKVYGGKFINFDPANNVSEGANTDFVAKGYKSWEVEDGTEKYYVVTKNDVTDVVADEEGLKNAGANAVLGQDLTINETLSMAAGNTINGNGNTLTLNVDDDGTHALGINVQGGEIKNLIIDGENKKSENGIGYRALWLDNVTEDVVIDNVQISGVGYTLNTGNNIAAGLKLTVSNSTLIGWGSYDKFASANFNNVHFGKGTYYQSTTNPEFDGGIRPYVSTTFTNCTFEAGFHLMLDELATGETITLKNCMVGDQVINAENIMTLLNVVPDATKIIFE